MIFIELLPFFNCNVYANISYSYITSLVYISLTSCFITSTFVVYIFKIKFNFTVQNNKLPVIYFLFSCFKCIIYQYFYIAMLPLLLKLNLSNSSDSSTMKFIKTKEKSPLTDPNI